MSTIDVDPTDVAVEMLRAELPGFESRMMTARDAIGIRGALPIGASLPAETLFYPIMHRGGIFVDVDERCRLAREETIVEREARHAKQREALRRELAPVIEKITTEIRRLAIEAVGLEPVIREREHRAIEAGRRDGYAAGLEAGKREGRVELLAEISDALEGLQS